MKAKYFSTYILDSIHLEYLLLLLLLFTSGTLQAQDGLGIGTKIIPAYSVIEIWGEQGGVHLPLMTSEERDSISLGSDPEAVGLMIFNSSDSLVQVWNGYTWNNSPAQFRLGSIQSNTLYALSGSMDGIVVNDFRLEVAPGGVGLSALGAALADSNKLFATDSQGQGILYTQYAQTNSIQLTDGLSYGSNQQIQLGGPGSQLDQDTVQLYLDSFQFSTINQSGSTGIFSVGASEAGDDPVLLVITPGFEEEGMPSMAGVGINLEKINTAPSTALELNGRIALNEIAVDASSGKAEISAEISSQYGQVVLVGASNDFELLIETPHSYSTGQQLMIVNSSPYIATFWSANSSFADVIPGGTAREYSLSYKPQEDLYFWQALGGNSSITGVYLGQVKIPPFGYQSYSDGQYDTEDWKVTNMNSNLSSTYNFATAQITYSYQGQTTFNPSQLSPVVSANSTANGDNFNINVSQLTANSIQLCVCRSNAGGIYGQTTYKTWNATDGSANIMLLNLAQ